MGEERDLKKLTRNFLVPFLKKEGREFKILKKVQRISQNGKKYTLDYLVIDDDLGEEIGVCCKEWKRSVAVNVVNSFIKKINDLNLSFGIMVADEFSGPAKTRERNCDSLILINRKQMEKWLQS